VFFLRHEAKHVNLIRCWEWWQSDAIVIVVHRRWYYVCWLDSSCCRRIYSEVGLYLSRTHLSGQDCLWCVRDICGELTFMRNVQENKSDGDV
jgi:hypothetical protein